MIPPSIAAEQETFTGVGATVGTADQQWIFRRRKASAAIPAPVKGQEPGSGTCAAPAALQT